MQALSRMIGRKASVGVFKSAVKSQASTLDRRWKLPSWSTIGAEGISGGAVKRSERTPMAKELCWADTDTKRGKLEE
ncbi:hypothetical protein PVK06_002353 [Gossypium arboreum]|uniref:Uncharacterized protein n=1 Tax=Gossypium arboreum TaxID=29729 RepID=A0ABR0R4Q5_GOSAR|nr:hypothetical protein PVK06_002353 [Gossypium arboreum]